MIQISDINRKDIVQSLIEKRITYDKGYEIFKI